MSAYDAAAWQNVYVMVGGAAAALTGLLFGQGAQSDDPVDIV